MLTVANWLVAATLIGALPVQSRPDQAPFPAPGTFRVRDSCFSYLASAYVANTDKPQKKTVQAQPPELELVVSITTIFCKVEKKIPFRVPPAADHETVETLVFRVFHGQNEHPLILRHLQKPVPLRELHPQSWTFTFRLCNIPSKSAEPLSLRVASPSGQELAVVAFPQPLRRP